MKDTKAWAAVTEAGDRPWLRTISLAPEVAADEARTLAVPTHSVEPVYIISEARYRELTKGETEDRG